MFMIVIAEEKKLITKMKKKWGSVMFNKVSIRSILNLRHDIDY